MRIVENQKELQRQMEKYQLSQYFSFFEEYLPYFYLVKFEKNEFIYQWDSQRQYLLFFLSGKIKVCSNLSNGKSSLLGFYSSFHILGDLEFHEIDTLGTTVQTIEPCTFITLKITNIRKRLLEDVFFLRLLSMSLADKLKRSNINNSINLLYPLENKLASYIYQVNEQGMFSENLTQLAELLGTSYRHLLRVLKEFQENGILRKETTGYRVSDMNKLTDLVQDLYLT